MTLLTVTSGTFNHNSGTVSFSLTNGCGNLSGTVTVDVNSSLTLYNVVANSAAICGSQDPTLTTASGDTVIVANNFTHTDGKLAGTWQVQGNYTVGSGADGGTAGITFTGGNAQAYTDSGGNEPDGDVLVNKSSNTVTLASNADWNATNQDVTVTSGTLASSTFNITTTNFTVNGGTFTGGSGTVTTSGPMVVSSGTFTGGSNTIDVNNTFTLSGGTFTSTSGTLEVGRASVSSETVFTISSGAFNHNNGTTTFSSTANCAFATFTVDVVTSLSLYDVVVNAPGGCSAVATVAVASGDTLIATHDFTHTDGILSGTWEVQNNVTIGSTADGGAGTLTYTTTGAHTYAYTAGGTGPHLRVNHAGATVSALGGTTALTVSLFSLLAGTFTAPTGIMTVGQTSGSSETIFTVATGTTFAHNSGTVQFSSIANCSNITATVDVDTSLSLYDVTINSTGYCSANTTVATGSGDTVIVTRNFNHTDGILNNTWQVQGNYTVASGADAGTAGINFTGGNNQTYTDAGGNEPDGDVTINKTPGSSVRLASNADWNATNQDLTITSGELSMGTSYNISTTALTVSADGHLSNNGTGDLTLAGNVSNSGNIRFRSSGACGGSDSISIASSSGGSQRSWSGTGTYLFHDVTVQDQGGSATITAYSSTSTSGNGGNWTFSGAACPAEAPAANVQSGVINLQSGSWNVR